MVFDSARLLNCCYMMASTFEPSHATVFDASIKTWVNNAKTPVNTEKLKKRKKKWGKQAVENIGE